MNARRIGSVVLGIAVRTAVGTVLTALAALLLMAVVGSVRR